MDPAPKRCLYEVLGLPRTCNQEEIRAAYKRLALQLHPDKLRHSSDESSATAAFQELRHAYDVLSDPRERSWYDSHRLQILSPQTPCTYSASSSAVDVPNLWPYFSNSAFSGFGDTGKGFFKVYGDVFGRVYSSEVAFAKEAQEAGNKVLVREAPSMGNLESDYFQVSAFYDYWLGFSTVLDFSWVDEYRPSAAPNRKLRRMAEDENNKLRRKARREYNEMIRGLAEFVKKRDKRVIERKLQKDLEQRKKTEAEILRKKEAEKAKREKAMLYEEPEWAKVAEEMEEVDDAFDQPRKEVKEFYCIVCSKKFKSDKQWKNHEQSKKHRMRVAEIGEPSDADVDEGIEDGLCEEFEDSVDIHEEKIDDENVRGKKVGSLDREASDESRSVTSDVEDQGEKDGAESTVEDEMSILEAMVKEQRARRNRSSHETGASYAGDQEPDDLNLQTCLVSKKDVEDVKSENISNTNGTANTQTSYTNGLEGEETSEYDNGDNDDSMPNLQDILSDPVRDTDAIYDDRRKKSSKKHPPERKRSGQNEANVMQKASSKGRKQKGTKAASHSCGTCGEDFDSRNKLFAHLSSTGHAMLRAR
ncbi:DNAJ JJJ1-like protein [Nymphaea thermarum]|nr:DNAJ JJJ1-like protein [Nymphaea thermarum]